MISQVKALITSLVQNRGLLRGLVEDPQGFAGLAGLGEKELSSLKGVGSAVSGVLSRIGGQNLGVPAAPASIPSAPAAPEANGSRSGGHQAIAIVGVIALGAVAGGLAVAATVSIVALAGENEDRTP